LCCDATKQQIKSRLHARAHTMQVLTLNVWGLALVSKRKEERMK
jgi:hypothetical protein